QIVAASYNTEDGSWEIRAKIIRIDSDSVQTICSMSGTKRRNLSGVNLPQPYTTEAEAKYCDINGLDFGDPLLIVCSATPGTSGITTQKGLIVRYYPAP